jgi:hypothetical protein
MKLGAAVISGRRLLCEQCAIPCAPYSERTINYEDPDTACPLPQPRWRKLAEFSTLRRPEGLGDRVARFAQPIARTVDGLIGTDIEHCNGCQKRRAALNRLFPG